MAHRGDRRSTPIWKGGAAAALLLSLAVPATHAQDGKPDDQYKYTPDKPPPASQRPQGNQSNYQMQQYPQYKPPQYPQYKPPQYPQYQPTKPGQYLQYPIPKGPPGQYRGSVQDQQACINDVFRLCNQFIPDAPRIVACLLSNRKNLSPPCHAVFSRARKAR